MRTFYRPDELSGKRWALQLPAHPCQLLEVRHFSTEAERDAWVAIGDERMAVGQRNEEVRKYRDENDDKWRASLRKNQVTP